MLHFSFLYNLIHISSSAYAKCVIITYMPAPGNQGTQLGSSRRRTHTEVCNNSNASALNYGMSELVPGIVFSEYQVSAGSREPTPGYAAGMSKTWSPPLETPSRARNLEPKTDM